MSDKSYSSPFFSEDIGENHSEYWIARRKVAAAVKALIEAATTSDIDVASAAQLAEDIDNVAARMREHRQLRGVIAHAKAYGSFPVANHEILCVGGASHPMAPGLRHWFDGDLVRGSVCFDWAYEGPPNHTHGGWVAAVLDHFMGMAQMRSGAPGMTGGLEVRYLKPTPLNLKLDLVAELTRLSDRKTRVDAELRCGDEVTASASAVFVKPRSAIFTEGSTTIDDLKGFLN